MLVGKKSKQQVFVSMSGLRTARFVARKNLYGITKEFWERYERGRIKLPRKGKSVGTS